MTLGVFLGSLKHTNWHVRAGDYGVVCLLYLWGGRCGFAARCLVHDVLKDCQCLMWWPNFHLPFIRPSVIILHLHLRTSRRMVAHGGLDRPSPSGGHFVPFPPTYPRSCKWIEIGMRVVDLSIN